MLALYLSMLEDDGDKAIFTEIYEQYERKIYAVAMHLTSSAPKAEDAVHDTMIKVIKHFDDAKKLFRKSCDEFDPWIVTINEEHSAGYPPQGGTHHGNGGGLGYARARQRPPGVGVPGPGGGDPRHAGEVPAGPGAAAGAGVELRRDRPGAGHCGKHRPDQVPAGPHHAAGAIGGDGI